MGPLALMDLIGLDTAYEILDTMYKQGRDWLHAPTPIIKQMVSAGLKGRKSGRGFYTYAEEGSSAVVADHLTPRPDGESTIATRPISRVGVVGSGTMATGIIEVFAKAGYDVVFVARPTRRSRESARPSPRASRRPSSAASLTEDARDEALGGITGTTSLDDLRDVDIVVEAVVEDLAVKRALFENLDEICKPGTILATTTSSLPVVECAAVTSRPQDVVGMHFFNPAQIMRLVEVVHRLHRRRRGGHGAGPVREGRQARRLVWGPLRLHRQRPALPLPQRRREDAPGELRLGRRHRHRHEDRLWPAHGPSSLLDGRPRCGARHPARALPRVPRARLRTRPAARAPGHCRLPRPQDRPRVPHLRPDPSSFPRPPARHTRTAARGSG